MKRARTDPRRAVGYVRASTDKQGLSPEAQRAALDAWSTRTGAELVAVHADLGVSGALEASKRPGLAAALADLRAHGAGVLVVAKRDRIARSVEVSLAVERMARTCGARVETADGVSGADDPSAVLLRGVLDLAAQHERAMIAQRTREALKALRARGRRAGTVPWGYQLGPGAALLPHEGERATIARAEALRASGEPLRRVAATLAAEGHRNRLGRPLGLTAVARMLGAPRGDSH